jgi:hypothetical protein
LNRFEIHGKIIGTPQKRVSKNGKEFAVVLLEREGKNFDFAVFGYSVPTALGLSDGQLVSISGELGTREYTDKNNERRTIITHHVRHIQRLADFKDVKEIKNESAPEVYVEEGPLNPLDDIPF